jgi:Lambda phage tail tube protein, TTP
MSHAVSATGILVYRNGVAIAEITEVNPGGEGRTKIDTSTHNNGESSTLGLLRRADPSFKINILGGETTHNAIQSDLNNNTLNSWAIVYPSGISRSGSAYVQALIFDNVPVDAKQSATITLSWAESGSSVASTTGMIVKRNGVVISEVTEVTPGGPQRNKIEVTTHNEKREAFKLGLLRQQEPSFKVNFLGHDSTHVQIMDDIEQCIKMPWSIEFPTGLKRSGDAYVQALIFEVAGLDTPQAATVTLAWADTVVNVLT